ncbi:thioredoxin-disulfide reductase [Sesbania bispinosa]|nr:thioredoxin-disulfide reductase [Sesbania bispinosa]
MAAVGLEKLNGHAVVTDGLASREKEGRATAVGDETTASMLLAAAAVHDGEEGLNGDGDRARTVVRHAVEAAVGGRQPCGCTVKQLNSRSGVAARAGMNGAPGCHCGGGHS